VSAGIAALMALAATVPLAALLGARYALLRGRLDAEARRSYARKAAGACASGAAAAFAAGWLSGRLALPAAPATILVAAVGAAFFRAVAPKVPRGG